MGMAAGKVFLQVDIGQGTLAKDAGSEEICLRG